MITLLKIVNGKPTIGYGITDTSIVRKGKISDSEANQLLLRRIAKLNNYLNNTFTIYKDLKPEQKTALISFSYNLGQYFIINKTKKMRAFLFEGDLPNACAEMADCDNVTQNGKLHKVAGLTRRRQAEMKLFNSTLN